MDQSEYTGLRASIERLILNDSSVSSQRDTSVALGQGWRLGFLGLLHMDVFIQRLEEVGACMCRGNNELIVVIVVIVVIVGI